MATANATTPAKKTTIRNLTDILKEEAAKLSKDALASVDPDAFRNAVAKLLAAPAASESNDQSKPIPGTITTVILAPLFQGVVIGVDATDGKATIAQAKDVFLAGIDSDFTNWGTDVPSEATQPQLVEVYEMRQNASFEAMFDSLDRPRDSVFWTQAQIIQFCCGHRDKLLDTGYGNLFPFKVKTAKGIESFVAHAYVRGRGLCVYVDRFDNPGTWDADFRHRVVVPQLQVGAQTL